MYNIYLIQNLVTNKVYIGQTKYSIEIRFKQHLRASRSNSQALYKSMRKHGLENFSIKLLESGIPVDTIDIKEINYISEYNSTNNKFGYNMTLGGNNSNKHFKYHLDSSQIETIVNLYNANKSTREIAKLFNVNAQTIAKILKSNNIIMRSKSSKLKKFNKIDLDLLEIYLSKGMSQIKIGKLFGCRSSAVFRAKQKLKNKIVEK